MEFNPTLSNNFRMLLRMSGAPRSASAIARGQSGNAGQAMAVTFNGSTNLGDCKGTKEVNAFHPNPYYQVADGHNITKNDQKKKSTKKTHHHSNSSKSLGDFRSPRRPNVAENHVLVRCDANVQIVFFNHLP